MSTKKHREILGVVGDCIKTYLNMKIYVLNKYVEYPPCEAQVPRRIIILAVPTPKL